MITWTLTLRGQLILLLSGQKAAELSGGSFYKLSLRRYVSFTEENEICFKDTLTYIDYKKIIRLLERESEKRQIQFDVDERVCTYIESRETFVEERSRLGVEIKNREEKLTDRFTAYKAVVDANMARPLRDRQMWDSFFLCAMSKAANFSVPGSGKTASVLGMYAYLRAKNLVKRIVVICPKNAFGSWIDEFTVCFDGIEAPHALNIHDQKYSSALARRNAILYESGDKNLILVNFESAGSIREALREIVSKETLMVFDEVHKVKRPGGEYASAALEIAENAPYVVALTGTPIPNSYTDIYNLLHLLFPDDYDTFFGFEPRFLKDPNDAEKKLINEKLLPFFCRTTKRQLGVPDANADEIKEVIAGETENRLLQILKMKYRKNKLGLFIRLLQMESAPKMLLQTLSLKDFAYLLDDSVYNTDEIDYADYSEEIRTLIENCGDSVKFTACVNLAENTVLEGKTLIIWCMFRDSIRLLAEALEKRGVYVRCAYGEVPLEERQQILSDFKNGRFQVLITNPHTLAESVSLHTVCHDALYFEYSYNLVHLLQSKDRIHRLGLPEGQYTQYTYLQLTYETEDGSWSMDAAVLERLCEKERTMLQAIDNQVLETQPTSEEDLDLIFSKLKL